MATKSFSLDTTLTLIAAYLGLFVGLIGANAINLALPAIRDSLGGGQEPTRGHWSDSTLDRHLLKFTQLSYPLDKPAVDSLSITPPGGATDSIRCAIPTCSPIVV